MKKYAPTMVAVDADEAHRRLDNFLLSRLKGVPRSRIYRMIRAGEVRVNKGRAKPDYRLADGDMVRIPPVRLGTRPADGGGVGGANGVTSSASSGASESSGGSTPKTTSRS